MVTAMDSSTTLALIGFALPTVASTILGLMVWSLKRNIHTEDTAKAQSEARIATLERGFQEFREVYRSELERSRSNLTEAVHKSELNESNARTQLAALASSLGELKGAINGVREDLDIVRRLPPDLVERLLRIETALEPRVKRKR